MNKLAALAKILEPNGISTLSHSSLDDEKLLQLVWGTSNFAEAKEELNRRLEKIAASSCILIGYPCDNGAALRRGSKFGPRAIRLALYPHIENRSAILDLGDIPDHPLLVHDTLYREEILATVRQDRYGEGHKTLPVSPLSCLEFTLKTIRSFNPGARIIVLGGDHSLSYATALSYAKQSPIGVLHFDAHTDLVATRNGLPYSFTTWAHTTLQEMHEKSALMQVGIRQTLQSKDHWESAYPISQIWDRELAHLNPEECAQKIASYFQSKSITKIFISCDIDVLSASDCSATGTPSPGNLNKETLCQIISVLRNKLELVGADLVEVSPPLGQKHLGEPEKTVHAARDILLELLK